LFPEDICSIFYSCKKRRLTGKGRIVAGKVSNCRFRLDKAVSDFKNKVAGKGQKKGGERKSDDFEPILWFVDYKKTNREWL